MNVRRRWAGIAALIALTGCTTAAGVPGIRRALLRAVGRVLVVDEPVERADIVVVGIATDGAGVLEAADLIHSRVSTRVAVFTDPPDGVDQEFLRRGVPYEDASAKSIRQLKSFGITDVEQVPRSVTGTEDEGQVLPDWCDQHRFRSVLLVITADHSRRVRRVIRRSMAGRQTIISVHVARHSSFDPDHWWETRRGTRTEIVELEKLLLDVVRHPTS